MSLVPVRLGLALQPSSAVLIVALERGYFEENGLDVTVREYPSGKRALNDGLFAGQVDLVSSGDIPVAVSAFERADFRVIATVFSADNVNRIVARKDAGIQNPSDLKGKRVGTQKGSQVHFFQHLFLVENGMSHSHIEPQFMKAEFLLDELSSGRIDAFTMREPYISQAAEMLGDNAVIFEAPGIYSQTEMVIANMSIVESRPEVLRNVAKALLQAEEYVNREQEGSMEIIARKLGVDKLDIIDLWPSISISVRLDQSLLLLLEDQSRWVINEGMTDRTEVPDFLDVIDMRGLESVKPEAVTIIR